MNKCYQVAGTFCGITTRNNHLALSLEDLSIEDRISEKTIFVQNTDDSLHHRMIYYLNMADITCQFTNLVNRTFLTGDRVVFQIVITPEGPCGVFDFRRECNGDFPLRREHYNETFTNLIEFLRSA